MAAPEFAVSSCGEENKIDGTSSGALTFPKKQDCVNAVEEATHRMSSGSQAEQVNKKFWCRCGKKFYKLFALIRHKKSKVCKGSSLKVHKSLHPKEYLLECYICCTSFDKAAAYKVHMRLHTGERPYKCLICSARFISSSNLRSHNHKHKTT